MLLKLEHVTIFGNEEKCKILVKKLVQKMFFDWPPAAKNDAVFNSQFGEKVIFLDKKPLQSGRPLPEQCLDQCLRV